MTKLEYGLEELGITNDDMYWDDAFTSDFVNDERQSNWKQQREEYGFDEREMWSLRDRLALFIYPRLKFFRDNCAEGSIPMDCTTEQWKKLLNMMLFSFAENANDFKNMPSLSDYDNDMERYRGACKKYSRRYKDGMKAFGIWFSALWI